MIQITTTKITKKCLLPFFVLLPIIGWAQNQKILAQSEYYAAEQEYNDGNYDLALAHLGKSEQYSGNNHLIQYLRVKALHNSKKFELANEAIDLFFEITPDSYSSSSQYKEMIRLVAIIKNYKEKAENSELQFQKALSSRDIDEMALLIIESNNLEFTSKVKKELDQIIVMKLASMLNKSTLLNELNNKYGWPIVATSYEELQKAEEVIYYDNEFVDTKATNNLKWMTSNSTSLSFNVKNLFEVYPKCPTGWRVPKIADFKSTLLFLGYPRSEMESTKSSVWGSSFPPFGITTKRSNPYYRNLYGEKLYDFLNLEEKVQYYSSNEWRFQKIDYKITFMWGSIKNYQHLIGIQAFSNASAKTVYEEYSKLVCRCVKDL